MLVDGSDRMQTALSVCGLQFDAAPLRQLHKDVQSRQFLRLPCLVPFNPHQVAVLFKVIPPLQVMKSKAVRAMPKSGIAAQVAESTGLKKKDVTQVLASLAVVGAVEAACFWQG